MAGEPVRSPGYYLTGPALRTAPLPSLRTDHAMNNTSAIGTPAFTPASAGQAGIAGNPVKSGQLRGEALVVVEDRSTLGDAAEEISMHFSEKAEEREHDEREVKVPPHPQVMQIEEIQQYLETAKALDDPKKLAMLAKEMIDAGGRNAGRTARQAFPGNESNQFALLQYALQESRRQGAPVETQEHILDAVLDLCSDADTTSRIYAGLNSVDAAAAYGKETGEASARDIGNYQRKYADMVMGGHSLSRTLLLMLEQFGGRTERFREGLKSLISALGADMAATRPSTSPDHLFAVRKGLYQLTVYNTLLESARHLTLQCGLEPAN